MDGDIVRRYFERHISQNEFYEWIGLQLVTVEEGRVVGEVPYRDRLSPPSPPGPQSIHGGVISTLIDLSAIGAVLSTIPEPRHAFVTTSELRVEFIEAVQTGIRAEGVLTDLDDRTATVSVEIVRTDEPERGPVATGEVTCRISESEHRQQ